MYAHSKHAGSHVSCNEQEFFVGGAGEQEVSIIHADKSSNEDDKGGSECKHLLAVKYLS